MPETTPESHFLRFRETGEREELARALELVASELMSVAVRRARDREEAGDLVQATFVTAIESADRFDAKVRLFPWLRGILINQERQRRRRRARRREREAEASGETRESDPSDTTHRKVRAGLPQVLKVRVQAARPCQLRFPFKATKASALNSTLLLRILDASDQTVYLDNVASETDNDDGGFYSCEVGLPKGEYRVEASTRWAGRVQHSFRVESVGDEPQDIEIPIK